VSATAPAPAGSRLACAACGTQLAPSLLSCPACHALVHAAELNRLAAAAEAAQAAGDRAAALRNWRDALDLLPPNSAQVTAVQARIVALEQELHRSAPSLPAVAAGSRGEGQAGGSALKRGWVGLVAAAVFLLGKFKLLLLGLTKLKTLASMLAFLGVYWQLWGWKFALGFVLSIYIHEMGHVAALARYGIRADAPMFIPGVGAFVRLRQFPATVGQDARVGLAGPVWGLGAGLVAYAVFLGTGAPIWGAIARTAGWINLFNLIPVWQLDGGRGFRALARAQRWTAAAALALAWALTAQPLLLLLGAVAVWRAFLDSPAEPDPQVLALYAALVLSLGWLSMIHVPGVK